MDNVDNGSARIRAELISIIVPVLNEAANIGRFLKCLREKAGNAEIIVVDGGSSDGTFDLARSHSDRCLQAPPGRGVQMNAGAKAATGGIFWFLHADCE